MVNISYIYYVLAFICVFLSLIMLFSRSALTAALSLLGILMATAGIFGLMGEYFIASIQLVVYAGAIMVLIVFSIMLLNIKKEKGDFSFKSFSLPLGLAMVIGILAGGVWSLNHFFSAQPLVEKGEFSKDKILALGGNTKVLAHSLFTHYYIPFEAISIALLIALTGAVVLAKRKAE